MSDLYETVWHIEQVCEQKHVNKMRNEYPCRRIRIGTTRDIVIDNRDNDNRYRK